MKEHVKEISIGVLAVIVTLLSVWYFFSTMGKKQTHVQTDLYSLVAQEPDALLSINRPVLFTKTMLANTQVSPLFTKRIPSVLLTIISRSPLPSFLLSFHPQGVLLYTKADKKQVGQLQSELLRPLFGGYAPQQQETNGTRCYYYAESGNRFFGCYYKEGVWIGSYSKKLLEASLQKTATSGYVLSSELQELCQKADNHAPLNLFLPTSPFNLYISTSDSSEWRLEAPWLACDLFVSQEKFCAFGLLTGNAPADSLWQPMADTLSLRIQALLPDLPPINIQISTDSGKVYYTGCYPIQ